MLRSLLACTVLALSASAALADEVTLLPGASPAAYDFVTSDSSPAAYGTTAALLGNRGAVGGLCTPGTTGCPNLLSGVGSPDSPTVDPVPNPNSSGPLAIAIDIPYNSAFTEYALSLIVTDDVGALFSNSNSPTSGNVYQLLISGTDMPTTDIGTTSVVSLNALIPSSGVMNVILPSSGLYYLGMTDLLESYVGSNDGLTGPDSGSVDSATWANDIVSVTFTLTPAPEPASFVLMASALLALGAVRSRFAPARRPTRSE